MPISCSWEGVGSSHTRTFSHYKGMQICGRKDYPGISLPNCLLVQTGARLHEGETRLHLKSRPLGLDTLAPIASLISSQTLQGTVPPRGPAASACRGRTSSAALPLLPGLRPRPRLSPARPPPHQAPPASPRTAAAKAWRSGISPAPLPVRDSRSGTGHAQSLELVLVSSRKLVRCTRS